MRNQLQEENWENTWDIFICLKVFSDFLFVFFIDLFFKWTCWPIYSQVHQEIKEDPNKQSRKWKT